jgi:hypothetical protein
MYYTAALPRWRRGLTYLAVPSKLKYDVNEERCIQILKCRVFLLLKMHKNVNINYEMFSLVF